jgi:hypothetical protein
MPENAPVIFFDGIKTWAVSSGIGHLDLAASLFEPDTTPAKTRQVSVAHLRFPMTMLPALKEAVEKLELASKPAVGKA